MPLDRAGRLGLCALPAALALYFSFNAGGFFPGQPAIAAVFLALTMTTYVTVAERPYRGLTILGGVVVGAFALFALWTVASGGWSNAGARALIEGDRALLYVLVVAIFVSVPRSRTRLRWMVWALALAITAICVAALMTRLFPDHFHVSQSVANSRLSFPISYWNTLGLVATVGIILSFHLATSGEEPRVVRVLGATVIPLLATTLYFTFSRGAIGVGLIGLVLYIALVRSPRLLMGFAAAAPPTAIVIVIAYHADRLASNTPTTAAAAHQGHRVALALALCTLGALGLRVALLSRDRAVARWRLPEAVRSRTAPILAGLAVLLLVVVFAAQVPSAIGRQYHRFIRGNAPGKAGDLRTRLLDPSNNGRTDGWKVAFRAFRQDRFHGHGAGTYQVYWERHRPTPMPIRDGHSLYFEVIGELGIVGLGLIVLAVGALGFGVARRVRGPGSPLYAAAFAVFVAWAIRAGVDWDWEMPAITAPVLGLAASVLAARESPEARPRGPSSPTRTVVAIGWLLVAVAPALVTISDGRLDRSVDALNRGDCPAARKSALSSINVLANRPQPYEVLGYCDLEEGFANSAVKAMQKAAGLDPENWQYQAGLATARAEAGQDPRPAMRRALLLNPREDLNKTVAGYFKGATSRNLPARGARARTAMLDSGIVAAR